MFNLDVAGPALTVDIEVEPTAELVRDGVAIVRGTFTCTAPTTFSTVVFVELTQVTGQPRRPTGSASSTSPTAPRTSFRSPWR